jgi:hypothetical protein
MRSMKKSLQAVPANFLRALRAFVANGGADKPGSGLPITYIL